MQKRKILLLATTLSFLCNGITYGITSASAQTQHWDTRKRAESQRLTSAALTFLNERNTNRRKSDALLSQAMVLLNKAVAADETDPLPHYLLGICLNMTGKYEQALDVLNRAYELDPKEPEIILATGLTQYLNGDYEKAIALWEKAADRLEKKGPISALLGYACMRDGDFESANAYFDEAKKHSTGSQLTFQGMAIAYYLQGDLAKARQAAEHALSLGEYSELTLLLARLDYLEGDDKSAVERMKNWNRVASKDYLPRSMTAMGFAKQHDFHFDPFENEIFDCPEALIARAVADEKEEAKKQKKRTAKKSKKDKVEETLVRARARYALNPEDFISLHETGLAQLATGDYKAAATSFGDALKVCPGCKIDFIYLADALSKSGAQDDAARSMQYYKRTFPKQKLAERYNSIATAVSANKTPANPGVPLLPGEGTPKDQFGPPQQDPRDTPF